MDARVIKNAVLSEWTGRLWTRVKVTNEGQRTTKRTTKGSVNIRRGQSIVKSDGTT